MNNLYKIVINILKLFDDIKSKKIFILLSKYLQTDSIVFDVGSHKGETVFLINKYLKVQKVYSFEISEKNFNIMKKKILNKKFNFLFYFYNFGFSDKAQKKIFFQAKESSSTTLSQININSEYFKKKLRILGIKKKENFFQKENCYLDTLDNFLINNNIKKIDLLKIDTEGHEYQILKGGNKNLKNIRFIYFEHHYDNMILKGYTFSEIHNFLAQNNFKRIYKSKMFFRKTFEYVYKNYNFNS